VRLLSHRRTRAENGEADHGHFKLHVSEQHRWIPHNCNCESECRQIV
jgi:hypothetical protein